MPDKHEVSVFVWGDFALFTRPEARVERVTYPVPTHSACRGILEAILWKPQFRWWVRRVRILRPIRTIAIRRNEVQGVISPKAVLRLMDDPSTYEPFFADSMEAKGRGRTQRQTIALRDVAYEITASVHLPNGYSATDPPIKYRDIFADRVRKGQCHSTPVFGCREFPAFFGPELPEDIVVEPPPDEDLGMMLLDISRKNGKARPVFFEARLRGGVVEFPEGAVGAFWKEEVP